MMTKPALIASASLLVIASVAAGTYFSGMFTKAPAASYSSPHQDTASQDTSTKRPSNDDGDPWGSTASQPSQSATNTAQQNTQAPSQQPTQQVPASQDLWLFAHEDWAISKNTSVPDAPAGWAIGFGPFYQPIRIPFPSGGQAPLMDANSANMIASAYGNRQAVSVVPVTPDNVIHMMSVPATHNNRLQHILAFWTGQVWMPLATLEGYRAQRPLVIEPTSASALFSEEVRAQRNLVSTQALAAYVGEIASLHPDFKSEVSAADAKVQFSKLSWGSLPGQQSLDTDFTIRSSAGMVKGKIGVDVKPLAAGVTLLTLRYLSR